MNTTFKCDNCGKGYVGEHLPIGWYMIDIFEEGLELFDACSTYCAINLLDNRMKNPDRVTITKMTKESI